MTLPYSEWAWRDLANKENKVALRKQSFTEEIVSILEN
jgi:hypothetical protein